MKRNNATWKSITMLILLVGIVEVGLVALILLIPDAVFFFIPLMVIVLVAAIFRIKRIIFDANIAKRAAIMRQRNVSEGRVGASNPFLNKTATAVSQSPSSSASISQTAFLTTLRKVAKEYAYKAQRQKYASYESVQEVCDKLNAYALNRGIKLGEKCAEALVMAMVSSKCIFVKKTGENTEDILSVVGEFFSNEVSDCIELETLPARPAGLVHYYQDNVLICTEFFKKVYATSFLSNSVCTCTLKNFSQVQFEPIFADYIRLFKNPYGETACSMAQVTATDIPHIEEKKFILPHNTWFFFLLNGDEKLPQDASLWSETIEIKGVGSKNTARMGTGLPMAYSQFNELIEGAFDDNFLPLETWKKLDKVEDYLFGAIGFKIDNILARQIERLTTMHVACGGTHAQAMDIAIAHKVLPLLAEYKKEQIDQEGTTLKELLDGLFGAENIPECHKTLSALQLD